MKNVWMFNVFLVCNKSLKMTFTCRIMIQFWFFMTSIYTWDPLSHSQDHPKVQVKRILMAWQYASKIQKTYYTWDPLSLSQDVLKVQVKRILVAHNFENLCEFDIKWWYEECLSGDYKLCGKSQSPCGFKIHGQKNS